MIAKFLKLRVVVRAVIRYAPPALLFAWGAYFLLWTIQSASFSVSASPIMSEIYKTRAMLSFPIAALLFVVGGLWILLLKPRERD